MAHWYDMTRRQKRRLYLRMLRIGESYARIFEVLDRALVDVGVSLPELSELRLVPLTNIPDLETIEVNGVEWKAHPASVCAGSNCCFHNPSDHPLKDARLISRPDRAFVHESGVYMLLLERVCPHGIGHADPDSVRWLESIYPNAWGVHGCDGCCSGRCLL